MLVPTLAISIILILLFFGCDDQKSSSDFPQILKIGVLPNDSKEVLTTKYEPLCRYLSEKLGTSYQLSISDDYQTLVDEFGAGKVDLAFFGGLTFVQAKVAYGAVPLVTRDVDTRFTSYFIVNSESSTKSIQECKNKRLAFGSVRSTSGHLMPRHYMLLKDIVPEDYFSDIVYSGAHDKTIEMVREGQVHVGAVNARLFESMLSDERIKENEFRIIWETPPYTNHVWAVQPDLNKAGRIKIRDAFLALSVNNERQNKILQLMDTKGFLPADMKAYSDLEYLAIELELLN